jgi:hypothetical protein
MAWEMETVDSQGRAIMFALERGLDPQYPFYLELYVRDKGEWEIVDEMQLEDVEEDGVYRDEDGSLSLNYGTPDEDSGKWLTHLIVRVEPDVLERVVAWANNKLKLQPHHRSRPSGLAERVCAA